MISCFCDLAASKRECADCSFVFAFVHFPNRRKCAKIIGTLLLTKKHMTKGRGSLMSHSVDYFWSAEVKLRSQDIPEVTLKPIQLGGLRSPQHRMLRVSHHPHQSSLNWTPPSRVMCPQRGRNYICELWQRDSQPRHRMSSDVRHIEELIWLLGIGLCPQMLKACNCTLQMWKHLIRPYYEFHGEVS